MSRDMSVSDLKTLNTVNMTRFGTENVGAVRRSSGLPLARRREVGAYGGSPIAIAESPRRGPVGPRKAHHMSSDRRMTGVLCVTAWMAVGVLVLNAVAGAST